MRLSLGCLQSRITLFLNVLQVDKGIEVVGVEELGHALRDQVEEVVHGLLL